MSPAKTKLKSAKKTPAARPSSAKFTAEERAAMKERARELKAAERATQDRAHGEADLLAKIDAMREPEQTMARRIHAIVTRQAPGLMPKTWYGMPAYATSEGKIVCFFQSADKFNVRYSTLGFNESAHLDDGHMWPIAYALTGLTAADETRIAALVKQAVS